MRPFPASNIVADGDWRDISITPGTTARSVLLSQRLNFGAQSSSGIAPDSARESTRFSNESCEVSLWPCLLALARQHHPAGRPSHRPPRPWHRGPPSADRGQSHRGRRSWPRGRVKGAVARLASGCRDTARHEAWSPAPRPRRPARSRACGNSGPAARRDDARHCYGTRSLCTSVPATPTDRRRSLLVIPERGQKLIAQVAFRVSQTSKNAGQR